MKVYRNRFASMTQQSCGKWIVCNEVTGLYYTDESIEQIRKNGSTFKPKFFRTYNDAREVMVMLTERYKMISAGRCPNFI